MQLLLPETNEKKKKKKKKKQRGQQVPVFMAEPMRASNSFVGTEEYIAPVCYFWTSFIEQQKHKIIPIFSFSIQDMDLIVKFKRNG